MKKWILIILLTDAFKSLPAQSYYFRNYQVGDGISSNTITCILQDSKGFLWFGTRNGLNRFDGTFFRQFRNVADDSRSIGNNSILSLEEDGQKNLWVGTHQGIFIYDPSREQFLPFKKIPQDEVRYIIRDKRNIIWFIAGYKVYNFNVTTHKLTAYDTLLNQATCLNVSAEGVIWYATWSGLAKKYNPATDSFTGFDVGGLMKNYPVNIQKIFPLSDSTVLVSTVKQTLLFNTKSHRIRNVFEGHPWADNIQVYKIICQSPNVYWLGSENGLFILNLATDSVRLIQKKYADPYSINDNVVSDIFKDREGSTWVGTFFGGVNYYTLQLNQFQKYFPIPETNSLGGNLVHEICADKYDNLWIGTEDGGLSKFNPVSGKFTHFTPDQGMGSISYQNIHGLAADGDTLWVGTFEHGLDLLDLRTQKVVRHFEKSDKPGFLKSNFIVSIYKTSENNILIGTWNGLYQYNRVQKNFQLLPYFARHAQCMLEDHEGTLWVASYGGGVYYYNSKTGKKGNFHQLSQDSSSLPDNYVNNLFEDSKKNMWFCTESGLCRFDHRLQRILRYSNDPFLSSNQVFKILEDNDGILWVSTSKGLISLNPENGRTKLYNTDYGLLSDQFNYNSGYKDKNGVLYFGGVKGMISFNPSSIVQNHFVPPVLITSLQVNNAEILFGHPGSRLVQAVPYTSSITLPYDSSTIAIQASVLSFTMPS